MGGSMKREIWFPIFLLGGFIFLIVYGLDTLSMRAMRFPLLVCGSGVVLALVEILKGLSERMKGTSSEVKDGSLKKLLSHLPELAMLALVLPLIWLLGFMVAVPLHAFLFLKFNGEKWSHSFIAAIVTWMLLYFVAYRGMKIPFNEGLLSSYLLG